MRYEKLKAELLAVRETRELRVLNRRRRHAQTLLQLSLNVPGPDKQPAGAKQLFSWGLQQLLELLPAVENCSQGDDLLGPWALLDTERDAITLKRQTIALENIAPAARLLDIDIYDRNGHQLGRKDLGLPLRACLLCEGSAVDCIRQQTHSAAEIKDRIDDLLSPFRS